MNLAKYIIPEYTNIESSNDIQFVPSEIYDFKEKNGKRYTTQCSGAFLNNKIRNVTPEKIADEVLHSIIADMHDVELFAIFYQQNIIGFMFGIKLLNDQQKRNNAFPLHMYQNACDMNINEEEKTCVCFYKNNWILVVKKDLEGFDLMKQMNEFVVIEKKPDVEPQPKKSSWFFW